jgi:hypothetical protein
MLFFSFLSVVSYPLIKSFFRHNCSILEDVCGDFIRTSRCQCKCTRLERIRFVSPGSCWRLPSSLSTVAFSVQNLDTIRNELSRRQGVLFHVPLLSFQLRCYAFRNVTRLKRAFTLIFFEVSSSNLMCLL